MVKVKGNQQAVQETNDSSILSKASIAEYGYFNDPYLKLFCSKIVRRSPLIQRGYYIRAKSIDYILKSFLQYYSKYNCVQVVSLGAGFDTSYFRLKAANLLKNCIYYEVDFPKVVQRKQIIIEKQTILSELIGHFVTQNDVLQSKDYYILPCDLTNIKKLETMIIDNGIDFMAPTLFFSECALTYIEYKDSRELCKWIQELFPNSLVVLYEQVNSNDAFGHVMLRHFEKIQSPLKRIEKLDTISKQKNSFELLNFGVTIGLDMNLFFNKYIDLEEKSRLHKLEVFDEFEEWHLKCSHYCIIGAFQGKCMELASGLFPYNLHIGDTTSPLSNVKILPYQTDLFTLQRFGHSCAKLSHNSYLCTGGFGVSSKNRHDKLDNGFLLMFPLDLCNIDEIRIENIQTNMKIMYHSITSISEDLIFIFGGRTSPRKPKTEYGFYKMNDYVLLPYETFQLLSENGHDYNSLHPIPRWRHAAAKIKDQIYIFGGRSVNDMALNDLWRFQLSSNTWKLETLSTTLTACHTHTLDVWNDSLVAFGGLSSEEIALNQLIIISLEETVLMVEEVTFLNRLPPRYSHTTHIVKDKLYVVGGIDPTCSSQPPILLISLVNRTWTAVHLPVCDPSLPLMLHNHCSVLWNENAVAVFGGGGNCFSFGTYLNPGLTVLDFSEELID